MKRFKKSTFSVLFIIRRSKLCKNGEAPISVRITVNGQVAEMSAKRSVPVASWNQAKECSNSIGHVGRELNHYLETVRTKIYRIHRELEMDGKPITAKTIRDRFCGRDDSSRTICKTYEEHNDKCRKLIGIDYAEVTVKKFETSLSHLRRYMEEQHNRSDLLLSEVDGLVIRDFEFYLKTTRKMKHNSTLKHFKNLKKIIRIALANDWLSKNPFYGIQFKHEESEPVFLTKEELDRLRDKKFALPRLEQVRDEFLFCCFTGFAFVDFKHLTTDHIVEDNGGKLWIRKARQKTNNMCNVPLLAPALQLIDKYRDCPECVENGTLIPTISNQKSNAYLKDIADLCEINKRLTTHSARHTCATTVLLANGVTMENVAKILGHSSTKMTQHYARVLDSSIMRDMAAVEHCFE